MSVATEAVAFLGIDSVIGTAAAAVLGYKLVARASVAAPPKPAASNGNGAKTAGTPAAGPETARTPVDEFLADGKRETPEVTG